MTKRNRRTVLGSVLVQSPSEVVENHTEEVSGLVNPEQRLSSEHARILAWIERDSRRVFRPERRRIFEIESIDGRSLVTMDADR